MHGTANRLIILVSLVMLYACASPPPNTDREPSAAFMDTEDTALARLFDEQLDQHPDLSGVLLLGNGLDAYVGRAVLARKAQKSIDLQYYMFHRDTVGKLLIRELLMAADRGVRVRMLIDDMYGDESDDIWSALDTHSNMEVRLYNPFARGSSKNLQFVTQTRRVNHRMHSKTFTIDNQASIVGGRNIGDEYFEADEEVAFTDLDALLIGPVVSEVSVEFDQYWNNQHSYPITTLTRGIEDKAIPAGALETLRNELNTFYEQEQTLKYRNALNNSAFANSLRNGKSHFSFSKAIILHDSADKMDSSGDEGKDELLVSQLAPYIMAANNEFILVSPYFVPGQRGADGICELRNNGVRVRILTNSLVSNDVAAVHTGYARHRKQLLRCGVELYELNEQLTRKAEAEKFTWLPGLSKSSLHAKTMTIDKEKVFVGSFNFDQRSLNINTEIGVLFRDPEIASHASQHFDDVIDTVAFRVELVTDEDGDESLRWTGYNGNEKVVFDSEPYAGFWKKFGAGFMRVLPIDSML